VSEPTPEFSAAYRRKGGGKYHGFDPPALLVERRQAGGYVLVYQELVDPMQRTHWSLVEGEHKCRALERIVVGDYEEIR
jgi:hypothetical protein